MTYEPNFNPEFDAQQRLINLLTAENKALTAQRDAMAEALKNARPLVEKWCHSQGNSQPLFATYLEPIDAALSKVAE